MPWLVVGINDRAQLAEAARELNARIVRRWQLAGVTIHDPATTWIDVRRPSPPTSTVLPGTQIRGATVIAARRHRSARTRPCVDCEVGEGATVTRTDATLARDRRRRNRRAVRLPAAGHRSSAPTARSAPSSRPRTPRSATAARCRTCRYIGDTDDRRGLEHRRRHDHRQLRRRRTSTAPRSARTCAPARTTCSSRPLGSVTERRREPERSSARTCRPVRWRSTSLRSATSRAGSRRTDRARLRRRPRPRPVRQRAQTD